MNVTLDLQKAAAQVMDKLNGWGLRSRCCPTWWWRLLFLILFWLLAMVIGRLMQRMVLRLSAYRHVATLMARLSRLMVVAIGVLLALSALNLDRALASVLAGIGIVGLAIGLASKDTGGDYLAGIFIHFTHPFRTGHLIQVENFFGYVESMEMRVTKCRTQQGQSVIIPNRKIIGGELFNYSITGVRRVDLTCGVSYEDDLQQAEELAINAVESLELRNPDRPVELFYEEFGTSSINFSLRFWTNPEQKIYLKARSEAIKIIRQTFRDHGITIPFPIRTLNFGITEGGGLREQLEGVSIPLAPMNVATGQVDVNREE